jgi:type II secretory pathway pseudopilin PulG
MLRLATRQKGETIIEVMLALSILGFVLGISYASASRSLRASQDALERSTASHLTMTMIDLVRTHAERFNDPIYNTTAPWNSSTAKALVFPDTSDTKFCLDNKLSDYSSATVPAPVVYSSTDAYCQRGIFTAYVTAHHLPNTQTYEYTATIEWSSIVSGNTAQVLMRYRWVKLPVATTSSPNPNPPPNGNGNASISTCGASGAPPCTGGGGGGSGGPPVYRWFYNITLYNTSDNPGLTAVSCVWDWGDGTTSNTSCNNGDSITHCYQATTPYPTYTPTNQKHYTVQFSVALSNGTTATSQPRDVPRPYRANSTSLYCSIPEPSI